jgi:hypothetical protein
MLLFSKYIIELVSISVSEAQTLFAQMSLVKPFCIVLILMYVTCIRETNKHVLSAADVCRLYPYVRVPLQRLEKWQAAVAAAAEAGNGNDLLAERHSGRKERNRRRTRRCLNGENMRETTTCWKTRFVMHSFSKEGNTCI